MKKIIIFICLYICLSENIQQTYNSEGDQKNSEINEYQIKFENKLYKIKVSKLECNDFIVIKGTEINLKAPKYYERRINLKDFQSKNKLFGFYESVNEVYDSFIALMNDNKFKILHKDHELFLVIQYVLPTRKEIDIEFQLNEKKLNSEEIIENLSKTINNLVEKVNTISSKVDKLMKFKEDYEKIDKEKIEKKRIIKEIKTIDGFNNSSILINKEDKLMLYNWLLELGDIKSIELCYKASINGDSKTSIENKLKNKKHNIYLIKTNKGRIFGAYTQVELNGNNVYKKDDKAFLFSINNKSKYKILIPDKAIRFDNDYCFKIGNTDNGDGIYSSGDFLTKSSYEGNTKIYDIPGNYPLSGESKFRIAELEIFNISF